MWQRIQSVYLGLVVALCVVSMCSTVGRYVSGADVVATFNDWTFSVTRAPFDTYHSGGGPWALGVLMALVSALNLFAIMLFRFRMRQLRVVVWSTILLIGYVAVYTFFALYFSQGLSEIATSTPAHYELCLAAAYPVVAVILNVMAIISIRRDEALVRSLDRLR